MTTRAVIRNKQDQHTYHLAELAEDGTCVARSAGVSLSREEVADEDFGRVLGLPLTPHNYPGGFWPQDDFEVMDTFEDEDQG